MEAPDDLQTNFSIKKYHYPDCFHTISTLTISGNQIYHVFIQRKPQTKYIVSSYHEENAFSSALLKYFEISKADSVLQDSMQVLSAGFQSPPVYRAFQNKGIDKKL